MASIGACFLNIRFFGILSVDTESDKPLLFFSAFGGSALSPQGQALGLVAECVKFNTALTPDYKPSSVFVAISLVLMLPSGSSGLPYYLRLIAIGTDHSRRQ